MMEVMSHWKQILGPSCWGSCCHGVVFLVVLLDTFILSFPRILEILNQIQFGYVHHEQFVMKVPR